MGGMLTMEIDDVYRGREHSFIKHELLKGYLEKLLLIVGTAGGHARTREITYVDCFAGPWGSEDQSLAGTSIAISLEILEGVRRTLTAPPYLITDLKLRAVYVEKSKRSHRLLTNFLTNNCPPEIEWHALFGDYSELQDEILHRCGKGFAFFFMDPLGWTDISITKLRKLATRPRSELLITFMYDFVNRFITKDSLREQITGMLGTLDESDLVTIEAKDPKSREAYVVHRYRESLKQAVGSEGKEKPRAYHAEVMDRQKDRTKYHMVYVTRHPKGIIVFAEQSEKVEFIQKVVRIQAKRDASGQVGLFPAEEEAQLDGDSDMTKVKEYWLSLLSTEPIPFGEDVLADMLETTGWLARDFQQSFGELMTEGRVENVDARGKRRTRFVHFEKAERLRRV